MRPGRRAWTADDDALLRRLIRRRASIKTMAQLLGRTEHAVQSHMSKRRLIVRQTKRSGMTDEQFRMHMRGLCLVQ